MSKLSVQDVCRVAEELGVTYSDVRETLPAASGRHLDKFSKHDVLIIDEWLRDMPDEETINFNMRDYLAKTKPKK